MASRGKKKTTFAKLNREARLRERRSEKAARKQARRDRIDDPETPDWPSVDDGIEMPLGELATTRPGDDRGE